MKKAKPIDRLMAAMDECACARGGAQWINGYRARFEADPSHDAAEATRLFDKEMSRWKDVERIEAKFRRIALRVLREATP